MPRDRKGSFEPQAIGTRRAADILTAVADGLKALAGAVEIAFPATTLQTRILHPPRNISPAWYRAREHVIPFFAVPTQARRVIALSQFALL